MLWSDFEAHRRSLRPPWGSKFPCPWPPLVVWATLGPTMLQDWHWSSLWEISSSGQWTLTTSRIGIWTLNLEIKNTTSVCSKYNNFFYFYWGSSSSCHPNLERTRFSLAAPTWESQLCDCWMIFIMELVSRFKWLIIGYVGDSGLNCPWHQGWYESSKFIGLHPWALKG